MQWGSCSSEHAVVELLFIVVICYHFLLFLFQVCTKRLKLRLKFGKFWRIISRNSSEIFRKFWQKLKNHFKTFLDEFQRISTNISEIFKKYFKTFWKIILKKFSNNILENVENSTRKFCEVFWKISKLIPESFMKYFVNIKICIKFWGTIW